MSTEYAVKMPLREFVLEAEKAGWRIEVVEENGRARLRLVDGSALGFAYDPHEVRANDGSFWTNFTRFGRNDVSRLASALGAVDEYSATYEAITGWSEDRAAAYLQRAAAQFCEDMPARAEVAMELATQLLAAVQAYRDEKRDWAVEEEQEPLPRVIVECPGCGWPWAGDSE